MSDLATLQEENGRLRTRVLELESQLHFLTTHKTVAAGIAGERIISDLIDGILTSYAASFDVHAPNGMTIEVKKAGRTAKTSNRWQWGKVLGESGNKKYDYLLLVGDSDPRYAHLYRDAKSPFVIFCVPYASVLDVSTAGQRNTRIARINTNPTGVRSTVRKSLYENFEVTMAELKVRFGI